MPRDSGRNSQTIRQLQIIAFLETRRYGASLSDLARTFGVATRTIRRDFDAIRALEYEITQVTGEDGIRYKLDNPLGKRIPAANLTNDELTALLLAHDAARADVPYGTQLASAMQKIEQALPPGLRSFMLNARSALSAHLAPPVTVSSVTQARHLQQLIAATRDHQRVVIGYDAAYSATSSTYGLEPYRVVASHGAFYLCAWVSAKQAWRVFALHRIETITVLDDRFEPTHALAGDPFGNSLGPFIGAPVHVELVFDQTTARYVTERRWHTSQYVRALPDGRLHLALDVGIDYALKSWILGFGRHVEVCAPEALVAWHRTEAAAMLGSDALVLTALRSSGDPPATTPALQRLREAAVVHRDTASEDDRTPHAQRALPFSAGWSPAPPVIVADAHGGGSSDAYDDYLGAVLREAESGLASTPVKTTSPAPQRASRKTS